MSVLIATDIMPHPITDKVAYFNENSTVTGDASAGQAKFDFNLHVPIAQYPWVIIHQALIATDDSNITSYTLNVDSSDWLDLILRGSSNDQGVLNFDLSTTKYMTDTAHLLKRPFLLGQCNHSTIAGISIFLNTNTDTAIYRCTFRGLIINQLAMPIEFL